MIILARSTQLRTLPIYVFSGILEHPQKVVQKYKKNTNGNSGELSH